MVVSEETRAKIVRLIEGWDHHNHRVSVFKRGEHQSIGYIVGKIAEVVERDQLQEMVDSLGDELAEGHAAIFCGIGGRAGALSGSGASEG